MRQVRLDWLFFCGVVISLLGLMYQRHCDALKGAKAQSVMRARRGSSVGHTYPADVMPATRRVKAVTQIDEDYGRMIAELRREQTKELAAIRAELEDIRGLCRGSKRVSQDRFLSSSRSEEEVSLPSIQGLELSEVEQVKRLYADAYEKESRDVSWALDYEHRVLDVISAELSTTTEIDYAECRTTQCRVILRHEDSSTHRDLDAMWGIGPFQHGGFFTVSEDGLETILYLKRPKNEF
ncbi:MAG: hypothetical protein KTR25_17800 [Myxococcales bacterium]|nr:hypothetical protein [Myxococcales bacterium]